MEGMNGRIWGIGDLVLDHLFMGVDKQHANYIGSAGGGSVWNVLANLASFGYRTFAVAATGRDSLGRLAIQSLKEYGINTERVISLDSGNTRVIFELIRSSYGDKDEDHEFTNRCYVCHEIQKKQHASISYKWFKQIEFLSSDYICVDKLNVGCLFFVRLAYEAGATTVLDFGQIGFLRHRPIAHIMKALSMFKIVLLTGTVADSIQRRADLTSQSEIVEAMGYDCLLIVSRGRDGCVLSANVDGRYLEEKLRPFDGEITDSAGAGDRLLATAVHEVALAKGSLKSAIPNILKRIPNDLSKVFYALGARGHLQRDFMTTGVLEQFIGKNPFEIRNKTEAESICPLCLRSRANKEKNGPSRKIRAGIGRNISQLAIRSLFAAERKEAIVKCKNILDWHGTGFIIGTGGSFAAAAFIAAAINRYGRIFCRAIKPLDYIRLRKRTDSIIVVSYSGRTKDCEEAIRVAVDLHVPRIVLVTAKPNAALSDCLPDGQYIICYGNGGVGERGFVSVSGTVAPCVLWTAACIGIKNMAIVDDFYNTKWTNRVDLEFIVHTLKEDRAIDIFAGGEGWPAAFDFESKLIEGGLGRASLHEFKDFSHGRFLYTFSEKAAKSWFVLRTADHLPYEEALVKTLAKCGNLFEVRAKEKGIVGGLELLIKCQYLIYRISQIMKKDISRPRAEEISAESKALYKWPSSKSKGLSGFRPT